MPCLWGLFKWRKRHRPEKDGRDLSLDDLDRQTLLQSRDNTRNNQAQDGQYPPSLQERYVRFGIGGAGNMRKSASPFAQKDPLFGLLVHDVTDKGSARITTYNGRELETIAR